MWKIYGLMIYITIMENSNPDGSPFIVLLYYNWKLLIEQKFGAN